MLPGASLFNSSDSFAMIRGGHVQLTVLGAMEVAENGDIANWKIPGKMVKGMGGAMDLVAGTDNIIVAMMHTNRAGESKLLKRCSLPLTGKNCIKRVITDLGLFSIRDGGFILEELAPDVTVEEVKAKTEGKLSISLNLKTMQLD
jgi:3-oxoacid CoA-transferase B subunit